VLAGKQTEIFQIPPYRMTCNPQFKLPQREQIKMKGDLIGAQVSYVGGLLAEKGNL